MAYHTPGMPESVRQPTRLTLHSSGTCPATMEKLMLTGLTHPGTFGLEPGFNTLGRNPTNDFRVHDATVSSFHCEIVLSDDAAVVRDLGSTNGTYIDGQRIEEDAIRIGQILRLGSAELRLEIQSDTHLTRISIPRVAAEPAPVATTLPDGCPACLNHPAVHAAYRCTRCQKGFCSDCVHVLRLAGGTTRVFCPSCSGHCAPLPVPAGVVAGHTKPKKESLFGRLTQTIRIKLR